MEDINNMLVVEHNDFITSVANMDKVPLKIFELAVAGLDTTASKENNRFVDISKELLLSFFNLKSDNKYNRMADAVLKVHNQASFSIRVYNEKKKAYVYKVISPLEQTSWNDAGDTVRFQFTEAILPYLVELKKNITQYSLSDISRMKSKYSIVIYKWISMNYTQFEYYQDRSDRTKQQLNDLSNPTIKVDELRRITDTINDYERFSNFESRVLKVAQKEISNNTIYNLSYDKIKSGRSVEYIQFHITKKVTVANTFYKEEQQDPIYLEVNQRKSQDRNKLYVDGIQSIYTGLLDKYMMINTTDVQDIDLIVDLQTHVYPYYDKLASIKGVEGVKEHIKYVSDKSEGYSKQNLVKYLKKAIIQYIPRGLTTEELSLDID